MKNKKTTRIALALPLGLAYMERVLRGFLDFAREKPGWVAVTLPEQLTPSMEWLKHCQCDGALLSITSRRDMEIAQSLDIPVVNLTAYFDDVTVPTMMVDHRQIGVLAAQHLLEQNFRRFGYYGLRDIHYSEVRRAAFIETLEKAGGTCRSLTVPTGVTSGKQMRLHEARLLKWLGTLKTPVGIMACTDLRAGMVADACQRLGLAVPEDVAIIGVDNDPVACELCRPPLSSVARDDRYIGRCAAELLDKLLAGGTPPRKPILIAPLGVVRRRSTETLAIDDPLIAEAIRNVRDHLGEAFGVEHMLKVTGVSRRQLEYRFQKCMGSSPYAIISKLRTERAKQMLIAPGRRTLSDISAACGFHDLRRFRLTFQHIVGVPPSQFRKRALAPTAQDA